MVSEGSSSSRITVLTASTNSTDLTTQRGILPAGGRLPSQAFGGYQDDRFSESIARILVAGGPATLGLLDDLAPSGYQCAFADSGKAVLEKFHREPYDLVVVDLDLPHNTGLDILDFVRTTSDEAIPVIVIADDNEEHFTAALAHGAEAYLVRPIQKPTLLASIRSALRTARILRDRRQLVSEIRRYGKRLQTIVENVPGIVWESSGGFQVREHTIAFASSYFEYVLGYCPEDWQDRPSIWLELVHPEDQAKTLRNMERALESRASSVCEFRIFAKDGRIVPLGTYLTGMYDEEGRPIGLRGMSMDITERRRSEEELRRAKDAAEAASRSKDQFIAVLSHELRTPLTPVLSAIEMIETDSALAPSLRPLLDILRRNVELEARLIDDLLDLTRITKGDLRCDLEIKLPNFLHQLVAETSMRSGFHHHKSGPFV